MDLFLTGATGYIGGAVADALRGAGHSVAGLARSDESAGLLHLRGIAAHHGDLAHPQSLMAAALACDGVIHVGTTNDGAVDRLAVELMLQALAGSGKPFVYTSGIWVLGDTGGRLVDETAPVRPAALVEWRPAMERMVLAAAMQGVRATVIRPGIVYGRGGGIPAGFVESAEMRGVVQYVGTGENHWPVVHVEDLADLYVRVVENAAAGELFHAVENSRHSVREIAEAAGARTEPWPLEAARKTLGAYADALALDQNVSAEKAKATLGWKPRADGILDDLRRGSYVR
ncbi:MAG: NAD-dependent epimerase/dehydratase family protein [Bryobacteraceae bacterium]|jgi:nucleoside-diphosphate-sugar epimerase